MKKKCQPGSEVGVGVRRSDGGWSGRGTKSTMGTGPEYRKEQRMRTDVEDNRVERREKREVTLTYQCAEILAVLSSMLNVELNWLFMQLVHNIPRLMSSAYFLQFSLTRIKRVK